MEILECLQDITNGTTDQHINHDNFTAKITITNVRGIAVREGIICETTTIILTMQEEPSIITVEETTSIAAITREIVVVR